MAQLREHRRLVDFVHNGNHTVLTKRDILDHFIDKHLFATDFYFIFWKLKLQPKKGKTLQDQLVRERRIETLIKAADGEDFIKLNTEQYVDYDYSSLTFSERMVVESGLHGFDQKMPPQKTYTRDRGYIATERGTDLLTLSGFCRIWLEKNKIWGIILSSSVAAALIGWFVATAPQWACSMVNVLPWCQR